MGSLYDTWITAKTRFKKHKTVKAALADKAYARILRRKAGLSKVLRDADKHLGQLKLRPVFKARKQIRKLTKQRLRELRKLPTDPHDLAEPVSSLESDLEGIEDELEQLAKEAASHAGVIEVWQTVHEDVLDMEDVLRNRSIDTVLSDRDYLHLFRTVKQTPVKELAGYIKTLGRARDDFAEMLRELKGLDLEREAQDDLRQAANDYWKTLKALKGGLDANMVDALQDWKKYQSRHLIGNKADLYPRSELRRTADKALDVLQGASKDLKNHLQLFQKDVVKAAR